MSPTTTDHAAPGTTSVQLVVLRLGREEYALPIDQVQEIVFWTPPRPVSSDRAWVSGVIALRGKILPVYDLALRLGVPRASDGGARIVVLETGGEPIGVTVDDATEVLTVAGDALEPLPPGTAHDLLRAITKVGDRLIAVLDLTTLARAPEPRAAGDAVPAPAAGAPAPAALRDDAAPAGSAGRVAAVRAADPSVAPAADAVAPAGPAPAGPVAGAPPR